MGDVEGMAAHPSMQRRSTSQLNAKRVKLVDLRESALRDFPPSTLRAELLDGYDRQIAAVHLALGWRAGDDA